VAARPGEIATREDAIALLDAVCAFLERTEPAHPAPLLIRRARGWLGKDFLSVMQDLAPESLTQIHLIAGTRPR
jgi:type VI secretion system protein ImpA